MPEPKLLKSAFLLSLPCFDAGIVPKPRTEVERLVGSAQYWAVVLPSIRTEVSAMYDLLTRSGPRQTCTTPVGTAEAVRRAYAEFDDSVEVLRVLIANP